MRARSTGEAPHLYSDLASWFHLLTAPADYAEEDEAPNTTPLVLAMHRRAPFAGDRHDPPV